MRRTFCLLAVFALSTFAAGCNRAPREETIEVKPSNDPLEPARALLERYARGEPLGSEVTSFPQLVEDVRKVDPVRADILEKGLAEIQKNPSARAAKAKELLKKLAPSMT